MSLSVTRRTWLLTTFALGRTNYWLSVADAPSASFFLAWEIWVRHAPLADVALAGASGYMLWGLSEYAFHRWVYHQGHGILREGHRLHHEDARMLIAMPWLMTGPTMFGLWYLCAVMLRLPLASACLAGWLAGSVWYSLVHHGLHHRDTRLSWFRTLRAHHRIHHQCPAFNFGVTMRLWDSAFGTRYRGRVFTCFTADGLFSPVANWAGQVQTPFKRNGSGTPDAPRENPSRDPAPGTEAARD